MPRSELKAPSVQPIFGIPIFIGGKTQLLTELARHIEKEPGLRVIFTPNPEQISLSFHDPEFKHALEAADLNLPDGQGIVWALGRTGSKGVKRLPGREVFRDLISLAKEKKWQVFLLGGRPGSAAKIAGKYGFGFHPGTRDIAHESQVETEVVLSQIKEHRPELVFVAFGAPWQERWVVNNRKSLEEVGVKLVMVVGGAFDYEAGLVPQVPAWVEQFHLEWLWRLLTQPWRWKRQLKGLEFFWRVISST